ncbi:MAG: L,D-transpeptidase family protein [Caldilineaceae bacterium]|nr:L,D-transpeptidase family protein [Caldilineaceae bacterium]
MALRRPRRPSVVPGNAPAAPGRSPVRPIHLPAPQANVPRHLQLQEFPTQPQCSPNRVAVFLVNVLWILIGMVGGLLILAIYLYIGDLLAPGSRTLGMDLGGLSMREATTMLDQNWQQRSIRLEVDSDERTETKLETLGIQLEAAETVRALHAQARTRAGITALLQGNPQEIAPILHRDREMAASNLRAIVAQFEIPAVDARVEIVEGRAITVDPMVGRRVDVDATVDLLMSRLSMVINEGRLPLVVASVQPLTTNADLAEIAAQINRLLVTPLSIELYDPINNQSIPWNILPQIWAEWLVIDLHPVDGTPFHWAMDPSRVKRYLDQETGALGQGRYVQLDAAVSALNQAVSRGDYNVELRVYHRQRTHIVQPGETLSSIAWEYGMPYPWLEAANPNVAGGIFAGQSLTIPSLDQLLPLPVVRNKRIVVSLSQQRMWAYENGGLKWDWPVSTGIESSPTSPGVFQIQSHEENAYAGNWDLWMPSFLGIYRPVPHVDFMNGFHGFPTRDGANLLWTQNLGRPVTFGCILLSSDNAALLFNWAEKGVIVEVRR